MTSEEIANGNVLIAHFMGLKRGDDWEIRSELADWGHPMDLLYDESWDWLMPVRHKIIHLGYYFHIHPEECTIVDDLSHNIYTSWYVSGSQYGNAKETIIEFHKRCDDSEIIGVFRAIIEFINWYYKKNNIDKPKPIEFFDMYDDKAYDKLMEAKVKCITNYCRNPSGILWESLWKYENEKFIQKTICSGLFNDWHIFENEEQALISMIDELKAIDNAK